MGIGSDHHSARESIILDHHLVNDTGTRFPESDTVLVRYRLQEIEYLTTGLIGTFQIGFSALLGGKLLTPGRESGPATVTG